MNRFTAHALMRSQILTYNNRQPMQKTIVAKRHAYRLGCAKKELRNLLAYQKEHQPM